MRLTELEPRWQRPNSFPEHWRTGITFVCPVCRKHRVAVTFKVPTVPNPMSPMEAECWSAVIQHDHNGLAWDHTGSDFDSMSCSPSVNFQPRGCWHGTITNGEVNP